MSITLSREMSVEEINKMLKRLPSGKKLNAKKYAGVIKLSQDPLAYQKQIREAW